MARPLTGRVLTRQLANGRLAYDIKIRRKQVLVGYQPEWDWDRVDKLLRDRLLPMARLDQPWWQELEQRADATVARDTAPLTVEEVLSEYVANVMARKDNPNSVNAFVTPIAKHVGPFFAYTATGGVRRADELTGALVSEFTALKIREREVLAELPATLADLTDEVRSDPKLLREQLDAEEWRLLMRYGQRGGRHRADDPDAAGRFSISSRGLINREINRCLYRLRDALQLAEYQHDIALKDPIHLRTLTAGEPDHDWLRPDAFAALLDAAEELDASAVERYANLGRRDMVLVLGLAGPRVSELAACTWRDVRKDGLFIAQSKTAAGRRTIHLHNLVREALDARRERVGGKPSDPIFATATGKHRDRNSIRNRILADVHARARVLLEERGHDPMPDRVTPHTYRRTYLTWLAWSGRPQNFTKGQAGHKDAKLTLQVYQQKVPAKVDPRVVAWLSDDEG